MGSASKNAKPILEKVNLLEKFDAIVDGNQPYFIVTAAATSSDTNYNGLDPANVKDAVKMTANFLEIFIYSP